MVDNKQDIEKSRLELYKNIQTMDIKYSYFLLAIAASAIAFTVQRTTGSILSWSDILLGCAVICWLTSFFLGCKSLTRMRQGIYANAAYLDFLTGNHPVQAPGVNFGEERIKELMSKTESAMDLHGKKSAKLGNWQFRLIIIGAGFFLVWHIIGMIKF